ncbi:hypothetical protein NN3_54270 [Nocardia neocaledoniensis NBRC 108232]|uniref:DUF1365 family protein n=1 Tax=Nocardia neocaledoniensis TaxID=236511 RepID=A0A317NVH3_9NOCA|nr:DUF1365 domain-containing protein [Nocardia neocaledoniensis]PWV78962.1 hypothetical protein DFR69_10220 [Nocardia neocaledoniensis]GEM34420.1 hypothetical protein NN3_54270 [Nocardia neocaledoniensis NBRC 108232]
MTRARLVRTVIRHSRREPVRHRFVYRSYSWLVDLDDLPRLPWPLRLVAGFSARDHLGDPAATLRENVVAHLTGHGIDLRGGRILMLANARVLGYVFNPLTVFWCHDETGALRCVLAEVHNTYGERHRYLVPPVPEPVVAKGFYVSPFNPVAGHYRLRLPVPGSRLQLAIALEEPDGRTLFTATVRGLVRPASGSAVLAAALAHPVETWRIAARIRWQGLRLWRRGLPILPRTPHLSQEALP